MNIKYLLSMFFAGCVLFQSLTFASFESSDISGKVVGMGNAFTAISDDAAGLTFNPAGVSLIEGKILGLSYTKPFLGLGNLSSSFFGTTLPIIENFVSCGVYYSFFGEDIYNEKTLGFVIGAKKLVAEKQYVSIGVAVKNMSKGVTSSDDVIANSYFSSKREASGLGLDAGIIYKISDVGSLGLAVLNINEPDISFVSQDKALMVIKGGVSYFFMKDLLASLDFNYSGSNYTVNLGGEYKIMKTGLIGRIGGELGSLDYKSINLGVGYEVEQKGMGVLMVIDYGFKFPLGFIENSGTHIVSLTFKDIPKKFAESELK